MLVLGATVLQLFLQLKVNSLDIACSLFTYCTTFITVATVNELKILSIYCLHRKFIVPRIGPITM